MEFILRGFQEALILILACDAEIFGVARLSLTVSGLAAALAALAGVPLGGWIALNKFPLRRLLITLLNTGLGLPPVLAGLVLLLLLARGGPLGFLDLLYTPGAMVLAQFVIALPIVTALSVSAMQSMDRRLYQQVLTLGAGPWQALLLCLRENRPAVLAAVMAGFGRLVAEVGAVMIVGGNIRHHTRMLTTATVLETQMGNYDRAIAIGLILLGIGFAVNLALTLLQQGRREA